MVRPETPIRFLHRGNSYTVFAEPSRFGLILTMNKAYHAKYNLARYHRIRDVIIKNMGGACFKCGSDGLLEIDHINPKEKKLDISKIITYPTKFLIDELAKCQLLCRPCHKEKTLVDLGKKRAIGTHGTLSARRYCNCRLCKDAFNLYMRAYKQKRRVARMARDQSCKLAHSGSIPLLG